MSVEEGLRKLLSSGRDWQRVAVKGSPGIFIVKAPAYRGKPSSLLVEINPVGDDGAPMKRRGMILRGREELETYRKLLSDKKLDTLLEAMEKVNPRTEEREGEELEI
ncbi:MAG: hypothetical protein QXK39_00895 [Nitrososphaerota archaeon]